MNTSTIYALSSGALPSGVAVVRLSGPQSFETCQVLCGSLPSERRAELRTIRSRNGSPLDRALVLAFPGPASFTGEDCVEFHLHGGRAVVKAVLAELAHLPDLRSAEPGEFTRRAFENGKLDLIEVEGLGDLIGAETEMQRRLAMEQAQGGASRLYERWARLLTHSRALIEAELDFSDEEDVPGSVSDQVWRDISKILEELRSHLEAAPIGERIRDGIKIVLAGAPNAGKSTLMNYLAQRDVAIVTPVPGTTRDILRVNLDLQGYAIELIDTAGLRPTTDLVEEEGIRRARTAIAEADIVLLLAAPGSLFPSAENVSALTIKVGTKSDTGLNASADLNISAKTGAGVEDLLERVLDELDLRQDISNLAIPSRIRHVEHLRRLEHELMVALSPLQLELRAEHLRRASDHLGRLTGRVDVEDLLGVIFSEFCVGK